MKIKRIAILLLTLAAFGILTSSLFVNTSAQSEPVNESEKIAPAQQQTEDVFSAGQNVEIKSDQSIGDAAVAGANVKISGKISGYAMAAGASVTVDAPIGNDLWAAGANVTINAPINRVICWNWNCNWCCCCSSCSLRCPCR